MNINNSSNSPNSWVLNDNLHNSISPDFEIEHKNQLFCEHDPKKYENEPKKQFLHEDEQKKQLSYEHYPKKYENEPKRQVFHEDEQKKQLFCETYSLGDMVWGKVKSHPWWPGHIYDEKFATNSVRRSKRKGTFLVAFFGDSSYGWFDPEELIPFEPNFVEKSKQISSKTFLNAVEEAVDEASRRRALGLACKCRNPYNFRPSEVKGYFTVDLGENEAYSSVYSIEQINKAREGFRGEKMVKFMKKLAIMPKKKRLESNLEFLKEKSGVLAYRRAVYEEFDETYDQAFGQRTVQRSAESREAIMHNAKAPLTGPMVIAESMGKKTMAKSGKKEHANRDKYIFKRREEVNEMKSQETGQASPSVQQPYVELSTEVADRDYVLQRRASPVPPDQQTPTEQVKATEDKQPSAPNDSMVKSLHSDRFSDPTRGGVSITKKSLLSKSTASRDQKLPGTSKSVEDHDFRMKTKPGSSVTGEKKKVKNLKRAAGDLDAYSSVTCDKKKKRKKEPGMSSDLMDKSGSPTKGGDSAVEVLKSPGNSDVEFQRKDEREDDSLLPVSVAKTGMVELLGGLRALALDPFQATERNRPAVIRKAFLKFRSLVFQKSLSLSPPSEVEPDENQNTTYAPKKSSENLRSNIKEQSSKPAKPRFKSEDPIKGSRKRGPSDRQEEIVANKLKKATDMKSLTADKKTLGDGKESVIARAPRPLKAEPSKRMETPRKVREMTWLVMKFPPQSTLPSSPELKARLARFGPLDHSRTRIFWKTFTCKVLFIYKDNAEAAYRYLTENNTLFGSVSVRCHTRPLDDPKEDGPAEHMGELRTTPAQSAVQIKSCLKKATGGDVGAMPGGNGSSRVASRVKFAVDEGENSAAGELLVSKSNNTCFADGGNTSFCAATNVTPDVNFINKNLHHQVVPQTQFHNIQSSQVVASQLSNPAMNFQFPQTTPPTNSRNFSTSMFGASHAGPSSTKSDIAQEMLTLMTRCNDLIVNLKSAPGYVPYHSL